MSKRFGVTGAVSVAVVFKLMKNRDSANRTKKEKTKRNPNGAKWSDVAQKKDGP